MSERDEPEAPHDAATREKVVKTDEEWRAQLDPAQYRVTRQGGTERAFTGALWSCKTPGLYRCVCCGQPLFRSDEKYDSGSGWPSYTAPAEEDAVTRVVDRSHGMVR
ncbi:MAG: peptide-methionine (R)-S-oxide reductase, partial [Myxococcales bacterium]|nr:peptide-methionine (R)-S-oxide reductase [Myxococcales bacterium]